MVFGIWPGRCLLSVFCFWRASCAYFADFWQFLTFLFWAFWGLCVCVCLCVFFSSVFLYFIWLSGVKTMGGKKQKDLLFVAK